MGQQQLLLLVLATIVVAAATIAGLDAFNSNQQQGKRDALVQRAIELGNEVAAAHKISNKMGGIDLGTTDKDEIARAIGLSGPTGIPAVGAGNSAECEIISSESETVKCGSDGSTGGDVTVTVDVDPDAEDPVSVNTINMAQ